jgi:transcriptional regulator with XRE-family HTH domain
MDFYERVKALVKIQKTTISSIARIAGLSIDSYNSYKRHHNQPRADEAVKIATALDVSVEYLVTGKNPDNISKEDCLLLDKWHKLDSGTKKSVNLLIDAALAERSKDTKK